MNPSSVLPSWNSHHHASARIPTYNVTKDRHARAFVYALKHSNTSLRRRRSTLRKFRLRELRRRRRRRRKLSRGAVDGRLRIRLDIPTPNLPPLMLLSASSAPQPHEQRLPRLDRSSSTSTLFSLSSDASSLSKTSSNPHSSLFDSSAYMLEIERHYEKLSIPHEQRSVFAYNFFYFPKDRNDDSTNELFETHSSEILSKELMMLRKVVRLQERIENWIKKREESLLELRELIRIDMLQTRSQRLQNRKTPSRPLTSVSRQSRNVFQNGVPTEKHVKAAQLLRIIRLTTSLIVTSILNWRSFFTPRIVFLSTSFSVSPSREKKKRNRHRMSLPKSFRLNIVSSENQNEHENEDYFLKIQSDLSFIASSSLGRTADRLIRLVNSSNLNSPSVSTVEPYTKRERQRAIQAQKIMMREIQRVGLSRASEIRYGRLGKKAKSIGTELVCEWNDSVFKRQKLAIRVIQRACRQWKERRRRREKVRVIIERNLSVSGEEERRERRLVERFVIQRKKRKDRRKRRNKKKRRKRKRKRPSTTNLSLIPRRLPPLILARRNDSSPRTRAAMRIQCLIRRFLAKKKVEKMRQQAEEKLEMELRLERELMNGFDLGSWNVSNRNEKVVNSSENSGSMRLSESGAQRTEREVEDVVNGWASPSSASHSYGLLPSIE